MSDEPQPQQPTEGSAPRDPQAAEPTAPGPREAAPRGADGPAAPADRAGGPAGETEAAGRETDPAVGEAQAARGRAKGAAANEDTAAGQAHGTAAEAATAAAEGAGRAATGAASTAEGTGPAGETTRPASERANSAPKGPGPASDRTDSTPKTTGSAGEPANSTPKGAGPASDRTDSTPKTTGSAGEPEDSAARTAGSASERTGSVAGTAGPTRERTGSAPKTAGPATEPASPAPRPAGPASEQAARATKSAGPASDRTTPASKATDPATQRLTPITDTTAPAPQRPTPAPARRTPTPNAADPAPQRRTPSPEPADPATQRLTPVTDTAPPAVQRATQAPQRPTPAPQRQTPAPHAADPATQRLTPVARTASAAPQRQSPAGPAGTAVAEAAAPAGPGDGGGAGTDAGGGKKAKRRKRTGWRRIIPTWRMVLTAFVLGVLLLVGLFFLGYSMVKIPPANAFATKQSNVFLYADGSQLARDGDVNRENVSLAQISKKAQHAVLAAEDRDFYTESAVDPKAMIRAAWNTATGKGKQSGSTITQQYVKNYYLAQEQTLTRKVREFFISIKLDRTESKDQILEGYLNTSYFGRNAYGIQAAAQAYYGIDATHLSAGQGAYLAALLNAPSEYDVVAHPENKAAAQARWAYVLDGMVKEGWLSEAERASMKFPMPKEATVSTNLSGQRGYIVQIVKDYLLENKIVSKEDLEAGGYRITTTLQKDKQDAFVDAVNDRLMDKLSKSRKVDSYVRAGGASVDPKTGKVVAMYNGIDYVKQYTPNAARRDFQVGSTFKPFVFTSAVENESTTQDGRPITPNTVYDGTNKRPVQGWSGGAYAPANEDDVSYGDITVRKATDKSVNSVYAQMAVDVGPEKVKETATELGLPSNTPDLQPYPSIALGTATASVLDMAEAYATLANHGKHGTYTMIDRITKDGSDVIELPERKADQVVRREAADTTTSVLQSVVESGTATAAQAAGRPAAGKTGTAEEDTAAWFAGYTPDLATVVSVMGQDPVTAKHKSLYGVMGLDRINGGGAPTEIWAQFTKEALKGKPVSDFDLEVQEGADQPEYPTTEPTLEPGTGGQDDGGTTGSPTSGGSQTPGPTAGQTQGQTNGGTTGTTTGGTPTTGTTTGGTTGDTTGGTTSTGGTTGDTTTGTTTGGTTGDSPSGGATGDTGTASGGGGRRTTTRQE